MRHTDRCRWLRIALALALCAAAPGAVALAASEDDALTAADDAPTAADDAPTAADDALRTSASGALALRIETPEQDARLSHGVPWLRVRGRVGAELFDGDVVIALDVSNSALLASGIDLDGDGVLGETHAWAEDANRAIKRAPAWTTDPDDSIVHAELVAAHALVDALGWRRNRIGLLRYTRHATQHVGVGPAERVQRALDALPLVEDWSGTDVGRALRHAARMLEQATPDGDAPRARAVLLCSHGEPSVPAPAIHAKRAALREAERLARAGLSVYVLGFGAKLLAGEDPEPREFLATLARAGGGRFVPVTSPATLLQDLPPARSAPDAIEIANRTTGEPAQGLRRAADGSFDALLPLAVGTNDLEVRAEWADGRSERVRRSVRFEPSPEPDAEQRRIDAELQSLLRARGQEIGEPSP